MRYYIADLHFGHENLNFQMDQRGFESAMEMDEYMIKKWNGKVRSNDEVVILGDFSIQKSGMDVNKILDRLNGKKYLIVGNHDKYLESRRFEKNHFGWIENYKELKDNKRKVILSHYPIMCYNGQYRKDKEGNPTTYMLYGHVHNSYDELIVNEYQKKTRLLKREMKGYDGLQYIPCQMINCFCMFSDYEPLTLDEWIEVDKKRRECLPDL